MKTYSQYCKIDENGIPVFNPFDYLEFYEKNIHNYHIYQSDDPNVEDLKIHEGITADEFKEKFNKLLIPFFLKNILE